MAVESRRQGHRRIKILTELRAELAQLLERQVAEFHALFQRESNCIANLLVRGAERNVFVNEIRCRGHRVQIARLRRIVHAHKVELQGTRKPCHEIQHFGHKAH